MNTKNKVTGELTPLKFNEAIKRFHTILENGPLGTRLKYNYGFTAAFDLTEKEEGKAALTELYEGDALIAQTHRLPIILNAANSLSRPLT